MATAASAASTPSAMGSRRVCNVCCQVVAAYTCPRCHKAYCSSSCYKQHGRQCTEAFFRNQATSHMKATRADPSAQQHMMRILQRLHEQGMDTQLEDGGSSSSSSSSSSGDSSDEDEAAVLAAAGLDPELARLPEFQRLLQRAAAEGDAFAIDPSQLSSELAAKLEALFVSGRVSHLVAAWQPWWCCEAAAQLTLGPGGQRVVVELTTPHESAAAAAVGGHHCDQGGSAALPQPPSQPLPSLAQLAGPRFVASPLLPWQLLQVLVAYCAVMRRWNGEPDCRSSSSSNGSSSSSVQGWEASEQLLLLAPPLTQLMLIPKTGDSNEPCQTAASQDTQEQQQQQQTSEVVQLVPDSVRVARMQLIAAAARLTEQHGLPLSAFASRDDDDAASSPVVVGGAVPDDVVGLLAVATADALALLRLGRPAVLLALADSWRLLEESRHLLKEQQQQQVKVKQAQLQGQRCQGRRATPAGTSGAVHTASSGSKLQQRAKQLQQHMKLAARKLHFFMVWCNEQPAAMYEQLAFALVLELQDEQAMSQLPRTEVTLGIQEMQPPTAAAKVANETVAKHTNGGRPVLEENSTQKQHNVTDTAAEQQQQQADFSQQLKQHELVCNTVEQVHQQSAPSQELLLHQLLQQQTTPATLATGPVEDRVQGSKAAEKLAALQQPSLCEQAGERLQPTKVVRSQYTDLYDLD